MEEALAALGTVEFLNGLFWPALLLVVAIGIEIIHSALREGMVASVSEALAKLTAVSTLPLVLVTARAGRDGLTLALVLVAIVAVILLIIQTLVYRNQREDTVDHLRRKVGEWEARANTRLPTEALEVLRELIDADFNPGSLPNRLSKKRRRIRRIAATWLRGLLPGAQIDADDLLLPDGPERSLSNRTYSTLAVLVLVITLFYLGFSVLAVALRQPA